MILYSLNFSNIFTFCFSSASEGEEAEIWKGLPGMES